MKKYIITLIIFTIITNFIYSSDENVLLDAYDFCSASTLLVTTIGLGSSYDAWDSEAYTDEDFESLVLFYQEIIKESKNDLTSLYRHGGLSYEEKEYIEEVYDIYEALDEQSRTVLKYSYTKKIDDANLYLDARKETYDKINALYDLDWE